MRTYKLTIAYDGSRYQGWQKQPDTDLTIQGQLEQAFFKTVGYEVEVLGSGRTDAGVHAKAQVASVILSGKVSEEEFASSINDALPEDIRLVQMTLVPNGFHARHDAAGKKYVYRVDTGDRPDVFTRKYTFSYPHALSIPAMEEAAEKLVGRHDFRGYTDHEDPKSNVRILEAIQIQQEGNEVDLEFTGTGFLYHMVRILTGTLLEVGDKDRSPDSVTDPLTSGDRREAGFLAPASGLCLSEVFYDR